MNSKLADKFTGKERDAETRLDFFKARYYSGAQGRFVSADRKLFPNALFDPQSLDKYVYVRNNPLRYVDPNGEDWWDTVEAAVNEVISNNGFGAGRQAPQNQDQVKGQKIGDAITAAQGAAEVFIGGGGEAAGVALDLTGIGAVIGVPVNVVSTGIIAHGGTVGAFAAGRITGTLLMEGNAGSSNSGNPGGKRAEYENPGHHDPKSPNFDRRKEKLPDDAEAVYQSSIKNVNRQPTYDRVNSKLITVS
jgi:RHS repeat-associated protein